VLFRRIGNSGNLNASCRRGRAENAASGEWRRAGHRRASTPHPLTAEALRARSAAAIFVCVSPSDLAETFRAEQAGLQPLFARPNTG